MSLKSCDRAFQPGPNDGSIPKREAPETIGDLPLTGAQRRRYAWENDPGEKGQTQQQFSQEANINYIVDRWQDNPSLAAAMGNGRQPMFGDFADVEDYQSTMERFLQAQELFEALPSEIRDRFANDPARLVEFMSDESNAEEAMNLGLISRPQPNIPDELTNDAGSPKGDAEEEASRGSNATAPRGGETKPQTQKQ